MKLNTKLVMVPLLALLLAACHNGNSADKRIAKDTAAINKAGSQPASDKPGKAGADTSAAKTNKNDSLSGDPNAAGNADPNGHLPKN
jgi:hypothetical protein